MKTIVTAVAKKRVNPRESQNPTVKPTPTMIVPKRIVKPKRWKQSQRKSKRYLSLPSVILALIVPLIWPN